jgi:hypothetical protein
VFTSLISAFIFFGIWGIIILNSVYDLQEPHELTFILTFPTPQYNAADFEPWIDGNLIVHGDSPSSTINISLYLNDVIIASNSSNHLEFLLNTHNYTQGNNYLTLKALTNNGNLYQKTRFLVFVPEMYMIGIGFAGFLLLFVGSVTLIDYLQNKSKEEKIAKEDVELNPNAL